MLLDMSVINIDNISHFAFSVCFSQIILMCTSNGFFTIRKNGSKTIIKFCVKNEIKCARTLEMLTVAYGESTISRTQFQSRQVGLNVKALFTVFFNCNGVVHHEFLPHDRSVNKKYCLEVMCQLCEAIRQKRLELWKNQSRILHHDYHLDQR